MREYVYYPGCSLKSSSKHYEESILPVLKVLGLDMEEMEDWNCCGATAYFAVDDALGAAVSGRNLSIAEKAHKDIFAPCAGCYLTLKKNNQFLKERSEKAEKVLKHMKNTGCEYNGTIDVKHPLEVFVNEVGLDKIREKVQRKLTGLKVACYYGCQVVRPYTDFDDPDYPVTLDKIVEALGAEAVDYSAKTRCCGGSLTSSLDSVGADLNYVILKEAKKKGADVITTICPLCLFNLEIIQNKVVKKYKEEVKIPVLFFTQLMGLAFGIPKEDLGFSRSIISLKAFWNKINNGGPNE
jgi:heterodisulfide reductase subunit B2